MTATTIDRDTITIPATEKYSDAWCACLQGPLDECGMWPLEYTGGEPYHWCPECYRDQVIVSHNDLLQDYRQALEQGEKRDLPTLEDAQGQVFSTWEARMVGGDCDGGHTPPRIDW